MTRVNLEDGQGGGHCDGRGDGRGCEGCPCCENTSGCVDPIIKVCPTSGPQGSLTF